jgi:hypothetical protein
VTFLPLELNSDSPKISKSFQFICPFKPYPVDMPPFLGFVIEGDAELILQGVVARDVESE